MDIIENQKHRSMNDLANAIDCYFELYSLSSPVAMSKFLTEEGFVRRAKANLIAPTYIQGRKFDKIFHVPLAMASLMAESAKILVFVWYAARK